jgi:hypothetical protein
MSFSKADVRGLAARLFYEPITDTREVDGCGREDMLQISLRGSETVRPSQATGANPVEESSFNARVCTLVIGGSLPRPHRL